MNNSGLKTCRKCGAEISAAAGHNLCGACLLEIGLSDSDDSGQRSKALLRDFGDYELQEELGRGGQGVVYRARQKSLNRVVALKVIALGQWAGESHLKRFKLEAEAVASLDDPHIVPIYEIGERDGCCFFSMKFVEGGRLDAVLQREPLPVRRVAEIVASLAHTVHHAHQRGLLHRDIKPANILLDTQGMPHLTDFGLAKLIEQESTLTKTMDVLGTPSYMSPEQARGTLKLTAATDVYGLGAVLYQLLTGSPPFAGGTTYETIGQLLGTEARKPSLLNPKVDRDIETICLKCIEKDPDRRYETAEALAEDLERWLRQEPILARPIGPVSRALKWVRRNPTTAVMVPMSGALVVALAVLVSERASVNPTGPETLAVVIHPADSNGVALVHEFSPELIRLISGVAGLEVSERGKSLRWERSTDSPEAIGRALKVNSLLLGNLSTSNEMVHLDIQLLNCRSGSALWRTNFTRATSELPYLQAQLTRTISETLGLELSERGRELLRQQLTRNTNAWLHYVVGRQLYEKSSEPAWREAIREFEQATNSDRKFAQAYAGLAAAHISLGYNFEEPAPHFAIARAHVRTALGLDATLPEAQAADGMLKYFCDWDWQGARQALDLALRLDPHLIEADGCYLHCADVFGQAEEALKAVQAALALHPTSIAVQTELGCAAYYARRFDEAVTYSRFTLLNDPDNVLVHYLLARALAQKNRDEEALATLEAATHKPGGEWSVLQSEIAYINARRGQTNEARRILTQLHAREPGEFVDPYLYAMIHASLGETEELIANLNLACDKKSTWIPSLIVEPKFFPFRSDPRFQRVLSRLNLPPQTSVALKQNDHAGP